MQYFVKCFNKTTDEFVGYYKETGKNCISKLLNGIKYWDDYKQALKVANDLDDGFIRDKDKHYYTAFVVVYGNSKRVELKDTQTQSRKKEEDLEDERQALIRKNSFTKQE